MSNDGLNIESLPEFDNHKLVTYIHDDQTGLNGFIAVHKGDLNNPAFGATRYWKYKNEEEALRDALKLSRAMSYKAALAGLNYGGGKGVIIAAKRNGKRKKAMLKAYADNVNLLGGNFITGTDVGLSKSEVSMMKKITPYMVGVTLDPSKFTALGLFYSIKTCLREVFKNDSLAGRSFAIQGAGKIGISLLRLIYKFTKNIYVADVNKENLRLAKKKFPRIKTVSPLEIHRQRVDVFSPCALSSAITHKNIHQLRCQIVAGGANNQLEDARIGELLRKASILYAPDYVINAGGLISVVDEYEYKKPNVGRLIDRIRKIGNRLSEIISVSKSSGRATNIVADEMGEKIIAERFPK